MSHLTVQIERAEGRYYDDVEIVDVDPFVDAPTGDLIDLWSVRYRRGVLDGVGTVRSATIVADGTVVATWDGDEWIAEDES